MGQYYKPCILGENRTTVLTHLESFDYANGSKLMGHSYIGNNLVGAFETLIQENPQRVVWAGDYAEECKNRKTNVYQRCKDKNVGNPHVPNLEEFNKDFVFIVNHTKKEYVDKRELKDIEGCENLKIHPLPLLTSEGNGQGGGDFFGQDPNHLVGRWARDIISVQKDSFVNKTILLTYKKITFDLVE